MIVQHHEEFDFEGFYEKVKSGYVGMDYEDFDQFMMKDGEKHSFIVMGEGADRVKNALDRIRMMPEAMELICRASAIMITMVYSSKCASPVRVDEIFCFNKFIESCPEQCELVWSMTEDTTVGDDISVILLVSV